VEIVRIIGERYNFLFFELNKNRFFKKGNGTRKSRVFHFEK